MIEYEVCDLEKNILTKNVMIMAKSPIDAAKKYIKILGEKKTIKRNYTNMGGRLVIRGNKASYVYNVILRTVKNETRL